MNLLSNLAFTARAAALAAAALGLALPATADNSVPVAGMRNLPTHHGFDTMVTRLEQSIKDNGMGLVAQASASRAAAGRGVKIPGNAVLMVFRNDYAVRMLKASVPAGIEAPLRLYVTENADGTTTVSYRTPGAVFAPYGNPELDAMAKELDPILDKIVRDAVAG
jgi:uncharacterized protein (DUF302 family)